MTLPDIDLRFARRQDADAMARMSRDLIETGLGWSYRPDRMSALVCSPHACGCAAALPPEGV